MANADLILTQKYQPQAPIQVDLELFLTAAERQKSRQRLELDNGQAIHFNLSRGSHIHPDDYFQDATGSTLVQVKAKPEPWLPSRPRPLWSYSGLPITLATAMYP